MPTTMARVAGGRWRRVAQNFTSDASTKAPAGVDNLVAFRAHGALNALRPP